MQTKIFKTAFTLGLFIIGVFWFTTAQSVPAEFYPNYTIQTDWNKIQEHFVQIEAAQRIWATISSEIFKELNTRFKVVFPAFPQDYNFKVIYEQCIQLSSSLSDNYSETIFQGFMNNCYKPLNQTIGKINSQFTVKANATRSPANGSAPLTVTFDARTSKDPSNETIPSKNFFWYYRDNRGIDRVIGIGNVINYTFEEAGNYTVHLTVRSSNVNIKGILDGEMNLTVDVAPRAANIVVYANTIRLDRNRAIKIWTQEAKKGVIIDGTATMPTGGRKIQSHRREITNRDGFKFSKEGNGNPGHINVPFNGNGEYIVKLTTTDNENNIVSESFSITVSDPVAIIKQTPTEGTTSTTFSFDASSSYSLTSRLKLYTREIFDSNGDKIDTFQGKSIKKQFTRPGNYMVKLTIEDELWQTNVDTQEIYVESSTPIPQFTITPTNKREQPSEFHLDATSSTDIDVVNGYDSLEYKRDFSSPNVSTIIATEENNKKVVVQFDEIGTHTIKLTVTDTFGKSASIERQVNVTSTLRPELNVIPNAITWGKNVSFSITTNKPIINYQWDFWDGDRRTNQENEMKHIYQKVGIYNVNVIVFDNAGNSNSVTQKVFIGETWFPIAAFRIRNSNSFYLQTNEICNVEENWVTTNYPAFNIDRYQNITIDPSISVNSKGTNVGLSFYFQPKYEEIYKQNSFSHRFNEIGCQFIDLTVDDTSIGKQDHARIWFKVKNALPTLKNLTISFPQYGNESWIWFQENNVQNVLDPGGSDSANLIIKVTAVNAIDPDGTIAYFKRFYHPKDNPNKILETRITPSNIPYTFFTLPREAGEFMFWVTMYDNDGGVQSSTDIIGNGPTIFFPPTNNNPDIPIVTLRSDKQTVNVGDTVTFEVIAKVTSDSQDFLTNRSIWYDFEGDGERDLITTKDRVTHTYTTPNEKGYLPKAAVIYRGYKGIWEGNLVIVKNGIKPILTFNTIGNIAIFRDLSVGNIVYRQICFDKQECAVGNNQYKKTHLAPGTSDLTFSQSTPITENRVFIQKYPTLGTHGATIHLKSSQGIEVNNEYQVTLSNNYTNWRITSGINLITIPETSFNNSTPEIYVAKTIENSILFYVNYEHEGRCFIDTDISIDSDRDGKSDNDQDIPCNTLYFKKYEPQFENIIGRLQFDYNGQFVFKNFNVIFEGFDTIMDQNNLLIYQDITTLINGIEDTSIWNADLKHLLDILRKNLLDRNQTTSNVIALENHISESPIYIDEGQKELLNSVISRLTNADTISAMGGTIYDQAKNEILATLPTNLRTEIEIMFTNFEAEADNLDNDGKKEKLTAILNHIANNADAHQIDRNDIDGIFLKEICRILDYYTITSQACHPDSVVTTPEIPLETPTTPSSGGMPTWLKVILRIVFWGIVIIGWVIVFFAVKAKLNAEAEAEDNENEEG